MVSFVNRFIFPHFRVYIYIYIKYMTLFVCYIALLQEVGEGRVSLLKVEPYCMCQIFCPSEYLCQTVTRQTLCFLCNHNFIQIIYITSFKVCQSFCQFLSLCLQKIRISLHNGAVTLTPRFGGTWNCSCKGNLVAIKKGEGVSKFKGILNLTERLTIFSLEKN